MRSLLAGAAGLLGTRTPAPLGNRWLRTNFRGGQVSLGGGLSAAAGLTSASLFAVPRVRNAAMVAGASGALAGYIDDHCESRSDTAKGLKGHLRMLTQGQVTTGALKIGIIGAGSAVAASILVATDPIDRRCSVAFCDWAVGSFAIAGTANLINLLDLRPGRALKTAGLITVLLAPASTDGRPLLAGTAGVIAGTAKPDLAGTTMLGDLGANALGAVLGTALAAHPSRTLRIAGAATAVSLILASEKVSFSRVIERNRGLSVIDGWGR